VDIIGEPLGYELGVGDEFMDFAQEFKSNLNEKIDKLNEHTSHSCKKIYVCNVCNGCLGYN
jgi:hypothetical protein